MLQVHRSESATALVAALADVLRDPAPGADPFAAELVAVGARGTERWIAQRLSHHLGATAGAASPDGICARVDFSSPARLLDDVVADVVGAVRPEHADAVARWAPDTLTWHVLEVLDGIAPADGTPGDPDPVFAVLRHHLRQAEGEDAPRVRRIAVAGRLAALLARYGASRPELLVDWAAGRGDELVPPDLRWQPEVFRRVRAHVGLPAPAELLQTVCDALRADPSLAGAPPRLAVFVVTRLAASRLAVLAALAEHREVHVFVQHPSPALWEATAAARAGVDGERRDAWDAAAEGFVRHPLLLSLSRDVRELQVRLAGAAPGALDVHHPAPAPGTGTLLGRLQSGLTRDEPPVPAPVADDDRSVQVHSCHGRARQVEVLREVVLGLLDADRTLQPRDVLVMCPDVEAFAPLVAAVFSTDSHPGGGLRVSVADRSALQTNPLLGLAARLLDLAQGRITATDVLDLAGAAPVRRRFGFDDEALEQVREWTVDAGVHWGLGPAHRAAWQLGGLSQGSWRAGLDRLLVGVALGGSGDEVLGGTGEAVVPLADVESSRVDLAGRLAELLERLETAVGRLSGRRPVATWCEALLDGVLDLTDTAADQAWWVTQLRRDLGDVAAGAARAGTAEVGLPDVAQLLADRFAGRPQRSNFRTGALTVCTLTPMRSVPHRVVCLLGMDDGTFPRVTSPDADDLLARAEQVGDRDPRSEDRQVLLDAVCSARDHLVVVYGGKDVRTGADLPPAVPVGELLDTLDRLVAGGARAHVVVDHPLQPTDPRNFTDGALGRGGGSFSYDRTAHAGALAASADPVPVPVFLTAALPPAGVHDLDLDRLVQFLQHPARGFLRQRLEIASTTSEEEPDDALPVELDGLAEWAVGDRALGARLAGVDALTISRIESARGDLPPGVLAAQLLRRVGGRVDQLAAVAAEFDDGAPERRRTVDVELDLDVPGVGRVRLTGTVRGVRPVRAGGRATGEVALTTTYSRVKAKQALRAWVELLALSASAPGTEFRTVVVGRADRGEGVGVLTLGPVPPDQARGHLVDLLALRDTGLRFPLPLPVDTAAAWAARAWRGAAPEACLEEARRSWTSGYDWPREDAQEENVTVWGAGAPLEDLVERWSPPPGAPASTPPTFAELVRRVWEPLLGVQRTETR